MLSLKEKCLDANKSIMSYGFEENQAMLLSFLTRKMWIYRNITICNNYDDFIEVISKCEILICNASIEYYDLYQALDLAQKYKLTVVCISWQRLSTIRAKYIQKFGVKYVLTDIEEESEITKCIVSIKEGKSYYSSNFYKILNSNTSDRMEYPEIFESFSIKEKMVFNFMLQGIKQERIAYILGINKNTVATYCSRVLKKSGVNSVLELYRKFALGSVC